MDTATIDDEDLQEEAAVLETIVHTKKSTSRKRAKLEQDGNSADAQQTTKALAVQPQNRRERRELQRQLLAQGKSEAEIAQLVPQPVQQRAAPQQRSAPRSFSKTDSSSNSSVPHAKRRKVDVAMPREEAKKATGITANPEHLHASWQAKLKQAQLVAEGPKGKHIKFDD